MGAYEKHPPSKPNGVHCMVGGCQNPTPQQCRHCGWRREVHCQRVDDIRKRGLSSPAETQFLSVSRKRKKTDENNKKGLTNYECKQV